MESVVVLLAGGLMLLAVVSPILALLGLVRASRLERQAGELIRRLEDVERRLSRGAGPPAAGAEPPAVPVREAPPGRPPGPREGEVPPPPVPGIPARADAPGGGSPAASPPAIPPTRRGGMPSARPTPPGRDFVSFLGPRLLVGAGGLAVVVFLGLFVRYAWENEWVGPAGRVLSAAVFSLCLVAGGLRLMRRDYRPLGQGLAAAGFAGLYVSAYAAHGFYQLVPRAAAAALMVVVLACAVALAERLGTRLLALLAWAGGYLTPVLLSTGADSGESLLAWLLLLGAGAVLLTRRRAWPEVPFLAAAGTILLSLAWSAAHLGPGRAGLAALGLTLLTALFALGPTPRLFPPVLALLGGGAGACLLALEVDRPMLLLGLLSALAVVATLARPRWRWAEALGVTMGAGAVLAWFSSRFRPERGDEALALGLALAGLYVLLLAVRGLGRGVALGGPETVTQVVSAALAWSVLDRVLSLTQPRLLGPAALALAALHLALGLAARRHESLPWARVTLGLAAVFVTLAIPVQLGLFGATLGWAAEGLVLVWLGRRQATRWLRLGGYAVLLLAVARLLLRHFPLHSGPFTLVLNPTFTTWLLVVVALGVAWAMTRPNSRRERPVDPPVGGLLASLGLVLLFALTSGETQAVFDEHARLARAAGDAAAAVDAQKQAGLALSLLWTVFATALLSGGLAIRSRALFYAAYGLFGLTAAKVVMVDLATLPTLHRMFSFLALGVLLLAGAWLNLRFRERLVPPGEAAS